MEINALLKEKYNTEKKLWKSSNEDLNEYIKLTNKIAEKVYSKTKKQDMKSKATLQNRI